MISAFYARPALRKKLKPYAGEIEAVAVAGPSSRDVAIARRMLLLAVIQNLAKDEPGGPEEESPHRLDAGNLALHPHLAVTEAPARRPAPHAGQARQANGSRD